LKDEGAVSKRRLHNIPEQRKLDVAEELLQGEILYRKGEFDQCFEVLKRGVHLDDNLDFDEPWGWMVPVRHALAALLSEQGLWQEAIDVYKQDLKLHPKNIWALVGLRDCLKHNGVDAELDRVLAMITEVSASTGVEPPLTSCACAVVKWNEGPGKSTCSTGGTGSTEEAKKSCCS
jgi:tetratricopeptide (TPR) repeat protein